MANWSRGREYFQHKQVLVLGAARSGIAAAHLLLKLGAEVVLNDRSKASEADKWINELEEKGAKLILGEHPQDLLQYGFDLIVKNPGIPYTHPYLQEASAKGIPVITEIELGYAIMEGRLIGITGSNGKTTTTTLVGEIFGISNPSTIVAGNIGKVFSEQVQESNHSSVVVTELSSFQLKGTRLFRPHIACLLNLYPHHLDYHETMEDYISSKMRLFKNQEECDYAVLNWDQEQFRTLAGLIKAKTYWFSRHEEVSQGSYIAERKTHGVGEQWIFFKRKGEVPRAIMPLSSIPLLGEHNLENVLASITIAILGGVAQEEIVKVIQTFRGVEHRLEYVTEKGGVRYYNDSKATNPEATEQAIKSFKEPVVLIAGGMERGSDLEELIPLFKTSVKALVAYGETKERFNRIAIEAGIKAVELAEDVSDAVKKAAKLAVAGDVILLSPACASWDLYSSFEERGRMFKEAVHSL